MRKPVKIKIVKCIANALHLNYKDVLAYRVLSDNGFKTICAVTVDTVSYDVDAYRVCYFAQCLYVPLHFINLSWGGFLEHEEHWNGVVTDEIMQRIKNTFKNFDKLQSSKDIINILENNTIQHLGNPVGKWKILAYTNVICGNQNEALKYIDKIVIECNNLGWQQFADQAKTIKGYLLSGEREKALDTLRQWQDYTINALKLTDVI